jgi:hypothetical protein
MLHKNKRWLEFWPTETQTYEEKINAISRFIIITGVVVSINNESTTPLIGALLMLVIIYNMIDKSKLNRRRDRQYIHNGEVAPNQNELCRLPTKDNPFSNFMFGDDYSKENEFSSACEYDSVKDDVKDKFNDDLYKSVYDVFDKENSQRQFYSMPNTKVVNEQTEYAEWLYGKKNKKVCKSNFEVCLGDEVGGGGAGF